MMEINFNYLYSQFSLPSSYMGKGCKNRLTLAFTLEFLSIFYSIPTKWKKIPGESLPLDLYLLSLKLFRKKNVTYIMQHQKVSRKKSVALDIPQITASVNWNTHRFQIGEDDGVELQILIQSIQNIV